MLKFLFLPLLYFFSFMSFNSGYDVDKVSDKILSQFIKKMKKKNLHAIGSGGGVRKEKINLISVTFNYDKPLNIESARKLIIECTEELLNIINLNDENNHYFEKFPATIKIVKMGIFSLSPNFNDTEYVELVDNFHGNISYNIHSSTGPFLTIKKETFEEAQAIVFKETSSS